MRLNPPKGGSMELDYKKYFTQKKLKDLGFSERLIEKLLPAPLLADNPHHAKAKPMKLWEKSVVYEAMKNKEFKDYQMSRQRRSFAMKKRAEEKRLITKNLMFDALKEVKVRNVTDEELYRRIIKYYKVDIDKPTIEQDGRYPKWAVNTIRHQLTNYNRLYNILSGKIGHEQAYVFLKEEILKIIARFYPQVEEDCARQILVLRINKSENKKLILEKAQEYLHNK